MMFLVPLNGPVMIGVVGGLFCCVITQVVVSVCVAPSLSVTVRDTV
jgi:hypothetical protein